jgi:hypothetical protein
MKTTLYLDGVTAYIRRYGISSKHTKKSNFQSLLTKVDTKIDMIVCNNTALRYENKMREIGYIVTDVERYDSDTVKYTLELA